MRVFYIYNVNDFLCSMYEKYPYKLYKMLEDAYFTKKHDILLSSSLYDQMIMNFNKLFMNNYVVANHKLDMYYYHKSNMHIISSRCEYSKLMVSSYCLKLKSNLNYPSFFQTIHEYSDNIFVCDFENQDYFWLNQVVKREEKQSLGIDKMVILQ